MINFDGQKQSNPEESKQFCFENRALLVADSRAGLRWVRLVEGQMKPVCMSRDFPDSRSYILGRREHRWVA